MHRNRATLLNRLITGFAAGETLAGFKFAGGSGFLESIVTIPNGQDQSLNCGSWDLHQTDWTLGCRHKATRLSS